MNWPILDDLESWSIDNEAGELRVVVADGREARQAWKARSEGPIDFKRVTFHPGDLVLEMVTPWDEVLEIEVYGEDDQFLRRQGRLVIYLDQNKWIQLTQSIHEPARVPAQELEASRRIIDLARGGEVILPLSSGHWVETSSAYGQRRTRLAATMVGLSRGWIMRDPLLVRSLELTAMFGNVRRGTEAPLDEGVFTLDYRHFHAEPSDPYQAKDASLPPEMVRLIETLLGAQSVLAVLLEAERTDRETVMAAQWAELHESFAKHLATEPATRPLVRTLTLFRFLADLGAEHMMVARDEGLTASEYKTWLSEDADNDIAALPYLGRNREVIHLKLQNAQKGWKASDLIDLVYLPCAAGYADHVVCEKHTGDYLQRANRRRDVGARVFTSVAELMSAIA